MYIVTYSHYDLLFYFILLVIVLITFLFPFPFLSQLHMVSANIVPNHPYLLLDDFQLTRNRSWSLQFSLKLVIGFI